MHMLFTESWSCFFYAPAIFNGGTYSITPVHMYVSPVCRVRNTFGFCAISFERIGELDLYTGI